MRTKRQKSVVLLNGPVENTAVLRRLIKGATVIAADGGIHHASMLNVWPELWIGDFDSTDTELEQTFSTVERIQHPSEKAASDGELAVLKAIEQGTKTVILVGAFGGNRYDHMLFHATMACSLTEKYGVEIVLTDGRQMAVPLPRDHTVQPLMSDSTEFSIVGITDLDGLTIEHAKWPLHAAHVPFGSTLTLSNTGGPLTRITLSKGVGLLCAPLQF